MSATDGAEQAPKRRATPTTDWSRAYARSIGKQVQRLRTAQNLQIKQLVEATERLGHPLPRMTISALEAGKRENVSVAELLVLAAALRVYPLSLLLPAGEAASVEIVPNLSWPIDKALRWLDGSTLSGPDGESLAPGAASRLADLRLHASLVDELIHARRLAGSERADRDHWARTADQAKSTLLQIRSTMRLRGQVTPALPEELQGLDDEYVDTPPQPGLSVHAYSTPAPGGDAVREARQNLMGDEA